MIFSLVILSVVLSYAVEGAVVSSDPKVTSGIEDYMLKTLEKFHEDINGGQQVLGYPSLDPLLLTLFNYSLTNSPIGFRIDIRFDNGSLSGLSNNEVSAVTWDSSSSTFKTKMVFPTIQMKATYNMDGNMFSFFPLIGYGTSIILASNTYATVEATLKKSESSLSTENLKLTFNEPRVKSTFTDSVRRGQFSGIASELLNAMGPQIFNNILKPIIADSMAEQLQAYVNRELSTVDGNELLSSDDVIKASV